MTNLQASRVVLRLTRIGCLLLCATPVWLSAAETRSVLTRDNTEITLNVYPAEGTQLFIWQPHEVGVQNADHQLAEQLAKHGIEVWIPELLEAYFLPATQSSMDKIPAAAYTRLLNEARITKKQIVLGASGRGVIPVLRGARQWQLENADNQALQGVVLLSPNLFVETPDPGLSGQLMPIATATNLPTILLQPDKSPYFWKLQQTTRALRKGGSEVMTWRLANLRDRFYFRPDADDTEQDTIGLLWQTMADAIGMLGKKPAVSHPAVTQLRKEASVLEGKKNRELTTYRGNPVPPPLQLPSLDNHTVDLVTLRGKVVIVNFWASWCPPCVYEMPSMQRLQDKYSKQPFTILGVNMAEDETTIRSFITDTVKVSFPILLDKNGAALKRWQVFAFPTTYVIDKKGKIRYALFGGLEWDTPDILKKINGLLAE